MVQFFELPQYEGYKENFQFGDWIAELGFGTFQVLAVSVLGTWKRDIRFPYFGTSVKRVIRYRYFSAVFQHFRKKKTYAFKKV